MTRVFNDLHIHNFSWWLVDKHPDGGIYGCFESHWHIWHHQWPTRYVCVFEDDALISLDSYDAASCRHYFSTIINSLSGPNSIFNTVKNGTLNGVDVLHLSCEPLAVAADKKQLLSNLSMVTLPCATNISPRIIYGKFISTLAYIIEPQRLVNKTPSLMPLYGSNIDIAMAIQLDEAAVYPPLFYQTYEDSNVSFTRRGFGTVISKAFFSTKALLLHSGDYSWFYLISKFAHFQAAKNQVFQPEFKNRCVAVVNSCNR